MQVNIREAKSHLSKLGELAWQGEEIVIAKAGEPWLYLAPYRQRLQEREMGGMEGQFWMSPDFDDPIEEFIADIENSEVLPRGGE